MTESDWYAEGEKRFGKDRLKWRFKCPSCGYVASVQDWKDAGASSGEVAFSCIGRALGNKKEMYDKTGGPCNYAGGGLFRINPVKVEHPTGETWVFDFAEPEAHEEGKNGRHERNI